MSRQPSFKEPGDWRRLTPTQLRDTLDNYLRFRIPGSYLKMQRLPLVPEIDLCLINDDYPRDSLNQEQAAALMDNPPYWGFCWGSGQALARWILDNPDELSGKTLVDLGCGSGVVGIAAKLAGAGRVILCDQDSKALAASRVNAEHNRVNIDCADSLETVLQSLAPTGLQPDTVITVADVFYDRDNLPLLPVLTANFGLVIVADSRLKGQPLAGMEIFARMHSPTVPDLDESTEFSLISLYRSLPSDF